MNKAGVQSKSQTKKKESNVKTDKVTSKPKCIDFLLTIISLRRNEQRCLFKKTSNLFADL